MASRLLPQQTPGAAVQGAGMQAQCRAGAGQKRCLVVKFSTLISLCTYVSPQGHSRLYVDLCCCVLPH